MQRQPSEGWFIGGSEGEPDVDAYSAPPLRTGPVGIKYRDTGLWTSLFEEPNTVVRFAELGCDLALVLTQPVGDGSFKTTMVPMAVVAEVSFYHEQPEPFPTAL